MAHTKIVKGKIEFFKGNGATGQYYYYKADIERVLYHNKDISGKSLEVEALYEINAIVYGGDGLIKSGDCSVMVGVPPGGFDEDGVIESELLIGEGNTVALSCPPFRDFPKGGTYIPLNNKKAFAFVEVEEHLPELESKIINVVAEIKI